MTVHTGAETIQGRKLFKDGNYMRKYGISFKISVFSDVQVIYQKPAQFSAQMAGLSSFFLVFIVLEMYNFAWNIDREVDKTTSDDTVLVLRFTMKLTMKFPAIF